MASTESEPGSPASHGGDKAVHLGTWKSNGSVDHANSDVFSLACLFSDILTIYTKRKLSAFVSHRSSKHRRPRESAPPDASFHSSMDQVHSWLDGLTKSGRDKKDVVLMKCISLVRDMMVRNPTLRPGVWRIEKELYRLVLGLSEEVLPHCGMHTAVNVDVGLGLFDGWGDESSELLVGTSVSTEPSERSTWVLEPEGFGFAEAKPGSLEEKLGRLGNRSTGLFYSVGT